MFLLVDIVVTGPAETYPGQEASLIFFNTLKWCLQVGRKNFVSYTWLTIVKVIVEFIYQSYTRSTTKTTFEFGHFKQKRDTRTLQKKNISHWGNKPTGRILEYIIDTIQLFFLFPVNLTRITSPLHGNVCH